VAFLLRHTIVVDLTYAVARLLGRECGRGATPDAVDAHVVMLARGASVAVITDPDDLLAIDPALTVNGSEVAAV
jgi:hypothetical protein